MSWKIGLFGGDIGFEISVGGMGRVLDYIRLKSIEQLVAQDKIGVFYELNWDCSWGHDEEYWEDVTWEEIEERDDLSYYDSMVWRFVKDSEVIVFLRVISTII